MRPRILIVMLVAALVLVGCADDPTPKLAAKPSPTPTITSSASPVAVKETPEDFIRRWFRTGVEMQATSDTKAFTTLNNGCDPCDDLVASVTSYYARGGYIRPASVEVVSITQPQKAVLNFDVRTNSGATTLKESVEADEKRLAGGPQTYQVRLKRQGPIWLMKAYSLELS